MKSTAQKRLARLAGLVLLSLLVIAVGAHVVQAAAVAGTEGRGGVTPLTTTPPAELGRGGFGLEATPAAGTQGRGGVAAVPFAPATGAEPASSGAPSTIAWIIVGSALAVLMLGLATWALVSRRRQRSEPLSVAFCARHPEHAMCGTS